MLIFAVTACATPPPTQTTLQTMPQIAAQKSPLLPDFAAIAINAGPGQFTELFAKLLIPPDGTKDTTNVVIKFEKLQPANVWAPVIALCVQGDLGGKERTCLNLASSLEGQVKPQRFDRSAENPDLKKIESFNYQYSAADELNIQIDAHNNLSEFSVNGIKLFESKLVRDPKFLALSCSSAICSFDFKR